MRFGMRKLILIKHAPPEVVPDVPSEGWVLSDRGRALCPPLAEAIRPHAPAVVVSSTEPKAAETGRLIASSLGVPLETAPGLHEHDRSNVPHMPSREFISAMELFFRRPDEHVLGRETADAAEARFREAVTRVLDAHPGGNVAVVSHGTVVALLVAKAAGQSPFRLWRELGLPSFVVLRLPELAVEQTVASVR
jgi:broad specificity phosphatase PhoE